MKPYWRTCGYRLGNFGDELVPHILRRAMGISHVEPASSFADADLVSIGSILSEIPHDFHGWVWGTGAMFYQAPVEVPRARVRAVRGLLSAHRLGYKPPALGDPGLLVDSILVPMDGPRWELSIVPHYADFNDEGLCRFLRRNPDVHVIDTCASVLTVLSEIKRSSAILSSSLHGLVCADAFGIPRRWLWLSDRLAGGDFKFRDYESVYGVVDPIPVMLPEGVPVSTLIAGCRLTDPQRVEAVRDGLARAFPDELLERGPSAADVPELEFEEPPIAPPGGFTR